MSRKSLFLHVVIILFMAACGTPPSEQPPVDRTAPAQGPRCFQSVTTSGDGSLSDTMSINLAFTTNEVTGSVDWNPQAKDRMQGTLVGSVSNGRLTALYTYNAEGRTATEQRVFQLGADHITILSGEMEERDGIWVLKDPDNAVTGMKVPEVDCP